VAEETAATVIMECSGRCLTLLTTIAASAKAEAIPARTMMAEAAVVARRIATPPPPTGGRLRSYRITLTLVVECSTSFGGVDVGVSGAHPWKDNDESGGRGKTRDYSGD